MPSRQNITVGEDHDNTGIHISYRKAVINNSLIMVEELMMQ